MKENGLTPESDERDGGRGVKETERDGGEDDVKHVSGRFLRRPGSIPAAISLVIAGAARGRTKRSALRRADGRSWRVQTPGPRGPAANAS